MKPAIPLLLALMTASSLCSLQANAHEFLLDTQGGEPFYQSRLPLAVYQVSQADDLKDIAILNQAGEQVPHALVPYAELHPTARVNEKTLALPVYSLRESRLESPEGLRLELEKSPEGTTLNVAPEKAASRDRTVLLVDAGEPHPPLQKLTVAWEGAENHWIKLEILSSNDLKNWSPAGTAVLLNTSRSGHVLEQNSITLDSPTQDRYLQIRPANEDEKYVTRFTGITAHYRSAQEIMQPMLWQEIPLLQRDEKTMPGRVNLDFEASGHYPARQLKVRLPQENTMTSVTVHVRNSTDASWTPVAQGRVYRLVQNGKSIVNPDFTFAPTVARYWRLQFDATGGGIGANNPGLALGWVAPVLIWNARGQPPYTLHVGQGKRAVNRVPIHRLLPNYTAEKARALPQVALLPASAQALPQSTWVSPVDYKRWLLWGGLILGVLLLAWMTVSLIKSQPRE